MQTIGKFHLKYPLISDKVLAKTSLILTMIGHKPTEWEEEPFEHYRLGFTRTPRARCRVPNCDDVFGLVEEKYPPNVQIVRFYHVEGTRKMVMIGVMYVPDISIDEIRSTIHSNPDWGGESMKKTYCVRYRNLR